MILGDPQAGHIQTSVQVTLGDEPHYMEAIALLDRGTSRSAVPADVLEDFTAEHLVLHVGELAWWLPYRVSRWLQEAMAV